MEPIILSAAPTTAVFPAPQFRIRQLSSSDAEEIELFFNSLSAIALKQRFMSPVKTLPGSILRLLANPKAPDHVAFAAEAWREGAWKMIGEARYVALPGQPETGEIALAVLDEWQGSGIGTQLLQVLQTSASANRKTRLVAHVLSSNAAMIHLSKRLGFNPTPGAPEPGVLCFSKSLNSRESIAGQPDVLRAA